MSDSVDIMKGYVLSVKTVKLLEQFALPLLVDPCTFLEIGVWHGLVFRWWRDRMYANHKKPCQYIGIDPYDYDLLHRIMRRRFTREECRIIRETMIREVGKIDGSRIIVGRSQDVLKDVGEVVSFAYVDGCHDYESVLFDSQTIWPKLRYQGVMVWDNYTTTGRFKGVGKAVDEFLASIESRYKLLYKGRQVWIEK